MKKFTLLLTKIVIVIVFYLAFRISFGSSLIPLIEQYLSSSIVFSSSHSGIVLSEIEIDKLSGNDVFSNIPTNSKSFTLNGGTGLQTSDPRILAMRKFLSDYNSPMATYSDVFITEADRFGLDWRLVASISGVESAFGNLIPRESNNGWGWRGGPGGAYSNFSTWKEGIRVITRGLSLGYGIEMTPFQIERAYCPPCYANPAHAWANGVTRFMNELDYYLKNLDRI